MSRRAIAWTIGAVTVPIYVAAIVLLFVNRTIQNDATTLEFVVVIASYLAVSTVLCSRLPRNPIGWLLLTVGGGILLAGTLAEYATYALKTSPGSLPFATWAAWVQNWGFLLAAVIILVLLLFPTGRVLSRRWRWVFVATAIDIGLLVLAASFSPTPLDVAEGVQPRNPLGVDALRTPVEIVNWVGGLALAALAIASVVSVILRFRRSSDDERQQLRWLAAVTVLCGASMLLVIVTSIGVPESGSPANDVAFAIFLFCMGIGIPVAIAVALLRYRLYDLDVVIKKAVVATVLVLFLAAVAVALLVVAGLVVVGPLEDSPVATLATGVVVGALAWPMLRLSRRIADRIVYGGRATPYEVLTEFSGRLAEAYATDDVLPRMASIVAAGAGATNAQVWLRIGRELRLAGAWPSGVADGRVVVDASEVGPHAFEVRHQGEVLGAIAVTMPPSDPMNAAKERLVRDLAAQAGLVLRNVRLIEELRASRRRLVGAQDEERRRLERDIHDGAQQQLVALSVKVRLAHGLVEREPAKARAMLDQIQAETVQALEDLRDLARGIYPPLLADEGLVAALEAQARKVAIPVEVHAGEIGRYGQDVEAAVYFCVLEALQNTAKYAEASRVVITLGREGDRLRFAVRDDGRGFDPERVRRGLGLQGMTDRLDAIGGELEVASVPGGGTRVAGTVPVTHGAERAPDALRLDGAVETALPERATRT